MGIDSAGWGVPAPRLAPHCAVCGTALSGPLSYVFRAVGIHRHPRNPNLCNRCNAHAEEGRIVELSVLFADLSSFTELTHDLGPEQTHRVVDTFLRMASQALVSRDAYIDKYMGDAVMAFFNVPIRRPDHAARAVAAAVMIQAGMPQLQQTVGMALTASIGVATGWARVGSLGSTDREDYTAIGDVVNLAARLEGKALAGEVLVHGDAFANVSADFPGVSPETLTLKGFREPVTAYRLCPAPAADRPCPPEDEGARGAPAMRWSLGSVIFAILGAPCAAGLLIGPLAVALGLGTLFGTVSTVWGALDAPIARIPLLVFGTLGALANLYTLWHARRLRRQAEAAGEFIPMTRLERRRSVLAGGMAVATLLVVASEVYSHPVMHAMMM